uniref:Protein CASC3 n=1 Tax=Sphaeramia orbicularis TaxID=375764 RepID=A0A672Y9X4_9TELE
MSLCTSERECGKGRTPRFCGYTTFVHEAPDHNPESTEILTVISYYIIFLCDFLSFHIYLVVMTSSPLMSLYLYLIFVCLTTYICVCSFKVVGVSGPGGSRTRVSVGSAVKLCLFHQGVEEEEAEPYNNEDTPAAAGDAKPTAAGGPTQGEEEDEEEEEEAADVGRRSKDESKPEEKGNSAGERQSGDGQESTDDPETKAGGKPGQQLDDDEDRKNPAYIPRKGLFFEHDVRGHAQEEERPKGRNRKLWKDEGRWEHDKFREEEQAPKSREELIAIYGYDIRNGGGHGERPFRQRRPRQNVSPSRDKRWRDGGERPLRSWQSGGGGLNRSGAPPPSSIHPSSSSPSSELGLAAVAVSPQPAGYQSVSPRRQQQEHKGSVDRPVSGSPSDPTPQSSAVYNREVSPPTERPVERKSYSLVRRTRSRPADLGSKQPSVEEGGAGGGASSPGGVGGKGWTGGGDGPSQTGGGGAALSDMDQDLARLSLSGQNWNQNPTSYIRSEIRGLTNTMHIPGGPPQFSSMDEMGVGSNRAKRYSSQRQRAVPEPAPPMHLGVMEGHYYEPMSYQGPIYTHGDGPAPIPPQGMLVQPEMHIPHPGLHPHQSGAPITNPALYGGPPVSLSPGQPQQLLPPPFYPPPGVMTFPYPAMYPNPQVGSHSFMLPSGAVQGQSQVTYGGVTYYDTVQQQAQPKPSPPRRTSQPVTVKPPPPEVPFASE